MKVICDRSAFLDAVNNVVNVVASRSPSAVHRCVSIKAADGVLTLAATDLEVGVHLGIEQVDIEEPGQALIPADKLAQIVRTSVDQTLTLETEDHKMTITGSDSKFTIYGYDPAEAPKVRGREVLDSTADCEVPAQTLHNLVQRTLFAAAAEQSRYAINGVLFERDGKKLRLVATDGRRLAMTRGQCTSGEGESACIIPTKALALIGRLVKDPEATVRIIVDENQVVFAIGDGPCATVLSSNLVEGTFPPFEDVIPKDQDKKATSNIDALASAVKRAALLTNEESKGIRLAFGDGGLTLTSRAPEMGDAKVEMELKYEGDPMEICFNPGFITEALRVLDEGEVTIELKAENKPGVMRIGNEFTYVVMPVNLT